MTVSKQDQKAEKKISIMQPYFFPYIGYFQLLYYSDLFVFYDDVTFIKRGWINRNRILINNEPKYITIPCRNISQHTLIKDIKHNLDIRKKEKLLKKIRLTYKNAPFFESVFPLFKKVINTEVSTISELASRSVIETSLFLGIETEFRISSRRYDNSDLKGSERIIDICLQESADTYVNSMGGRELYEKSQFASHGISLQFLEPILISYKQFENDFIPGLSILDVMMFNAPGRIREMLGKFRLH